jgi:thioredoxin reductase (NADPH)
MYAQRMQPREVIVLGGGIAGLSGAIYLGRAQRDTLVVDGGHSMAKWEPKVENYLGFPDGVDGNDLLDYGRAQARKHQVEFVEDEIEKVSGDDSNFILKGRAGDYSCRSLLLATGIFHIPPDIPGVKECLGHSMFFCKDCDGYRVRGQAIAVIGPNNETVEYALGMLHYSACVIVATNGERIAWDRSHAEWLKEYKIPVYTDPIRDCLREGCQVKGLAFADGRETQIDSIFTTRGDIFHTELAESLGAKIDNDGQIEIDHCMRTSVPRLYAAGCVTPANCQMIIAAGQGATAAQAINRDLFEESLQNHQLRRFREKQLVQEKTQPNQEISS